MCHHTACHCRCDMPLCVCALALSSWQLLCICIWWLLLMLCCAAVVVCACIAQLGIMPFWVSRWLRPSTPPQQLSNCQCSSTNSAALCLHMVLLIIYVSQRGVFAACVTPAAALFLMCGGSSIACCFGLLVWLMVAVAKQTLAHALPAGWCLGLVLAPAPQLLLPPPPPPPLILLLIELHARPALRSVALCCFERSAPHTLASGFDND